MLADFAQWLDAKKPTVVTWNGRSFDMPVITSRALRHGISMPWWFTDRNTRYRHFLDRRALRRDGLPRQTSAPRRTRGSTSTRSSWAFLRARWASTDRRFFRLVHAGKDRRGQYVSCSLCDVAQRPRRSFFGVELLRGTSSTATGLQGARQGDDGVHRDERCAPRLAACSLPASTAVGSCLSAKATFVAMESGGRPWCGGGGCGHGVTSCRRESSSPRRRPHPAPLPGFGRGWRATLSRSPSSPLSRKPGEGPGVRAKPGEGRVRATLG